MKSSLYRWGVEFEIPGSFESLKDFGKFFNENPLNDTYSRLKTEIIEVGDKIIVAIYNEKLQFQLSKITNLGDIRICSDATFNCMPKSLMPDPTSRSNQFFSLMIEYNGEVCFIFHEI